MKLRWEPVPYRSNAIDCFADTPRDATIAYGSGRWLVRKSAYIQLFTLKFNGDFIGNYSSLGAAMREAENRTGS